MIAIIIFAIILAAVVWGATYLVSTQTTQLTPPSNSSGEQANPNNTTPTPVKNAAESKVKNLTYEEYDQEVLSSDKRILIDFYATWCAPCRVLSPIVEEVAEEYDNVKLLKVNVDEEPELVEYFGITAMPTLVVMENGQIQNKAVGLMPKENVIELINY